MRDDDPVCSLSFSVPTLALLAALTAPAFTQTTQADLSARLIDKPLILKGFWLDDKLQFDKDGQPTGNYKLGSFTEAAIHITDVTLKGKQLILDGQRVSLAFNKDGSVRRVPMFTGKFLKKSPEKVTISIEEGDPNFSKNLDAIFADNLADIVPLLPDFWQRYAKTHFLPPTEEVPIPPRDAANKGAYHIGGSVKPPRPKFTPDPVFSEAARRQKFSGNVEVYLWAEKDGGVSHVQIVRPVGFGLDEKAIAAVSRYQFYPATRDDEPVTVDLYIDVNFQIF